MLVSFDRPPERSSFREFAVHDDEKFFICWRGLIFRDGARAGSETIGHLAQDLVRQDLRELCHSLRGVFVLFVFDRRIKLWQVAVDNAGLYHAFHDGFVASTSFLELLAEPRHACASPSLPAFVEFLAHDGVFWGRTPVEGITRVAANEIVELRPPTLGGARSAILRQKLLPAAGAVDEAGFVAHYAHLAAALTGRRVSLDLTGGLDSRLTACLLSEQALDFETAIVGRPELDEVVIAGRAAQALDRPLHITVHDPSALEDELPEMFRQCDGLSDVLAYHRSWQLSCDRLRRGVEVVVSSVGGELYKDFWWLQDWPWYRSVWSNFARLYDLRIHPVSLPGTYLSAAATVAYRDLRRRTLEGFERLCAQYNTESYDNVYFFYKMPQAAGCFATATVDQGLEVTAPFLDYDNFLFGAGLPRSRRFLNRFHREMLSSRCPKLACLITTTGVSARKGAGPLFTDLAGYTSNLSRRLVRKVGERVLRRRWMAAADPASPDIAARTRRSARFRQAVQDLKQADVLHPELADDDIRDGDIGRILTLGMLVSHLSRSS